MSEKVLDAALQIALHTASLATANTLLLKRKGLLSPDEGAEMAAIFREMARLFEGIGNDNAAGRLWTAAGALDDTARRRPQ